MKQKFKNLLHTEHPQHEILALAMVGIGLLLISNDNYFFWPPFLVNFLNDDLIGGIFVVIGILIFKWAQSTSGKIYSNRNLLIIAAGLLAFASSAEFVLGVISHNPYMYMTGFVELIVMMFDFSIIGKSKKHNY
ncbi:hypothetical protein [Lactobacillus johnsonii]|uniref:hypothetical protein n=1 Tax=Lactobacillus johnsonii TaxID=33959 RepID=UPI000A379DC3|nr:hypothetical protein [Lactobacillus johnsonii]OUL53621.1 hypothetical protein B2G48_06160 [Lactobacillus johnsonii]